MIGNIILYLQTIVEKANCEVYADPAGGSREEKPRSAVQTVGRGIPGK
jgi:hypothetical protein